jgi:hypothetical protein
MMDILSIFAACLTLLLFFRVQLSATLVIAATNTAFWTGLIALFGWIAS